MDKTHHLNKSFPEHAKLVAVHAQSQTCGDFLEWLQSEEITLCQYQHGRFLPINYAVETLLAKFFGINLTVLEEEKREMISKLGQD